MNILTKISVVVVAVIAVVSLAVMLTLVSTSQNYHASWLQEATARNIADQYAVNTMLALRRSELNLAAKSKDFEELQTRSTAQAQELGSKNDELSVRVAQLTLQVDGFKNGLDRLQKNVEYEQMQRVAAQKLADTRSTQLDLANKDLFAATNLAQQAEAKNQSLSTALKDSEATIEDLKQQYHALQEEKTGTAAAPGTQPPGEGTATAAPRITGTVTAVERDTVSVNIGSAKGVTKGMVLVIYRGDKLIAHLKVQDVEVGQAAGVVYDKQADPQQGDSVATSSALRS